MRERLRRWGRSQVELVTNMARNPQDPSAELGRAGPAMS
jgi:hypothetical protein